MANAKTLAKIEAELSYMYRNKAWASLTSREQTSFLLRINMAKDMIVSFPKENFQTGWPFLIKKGYVTFTAKYNTGNINVTQYDATIAGGSSSPVFTAAMAGRLLIVASGTEPYRIDSWTSATALELKTNYAQSTAANQSYSIVQDEYNLASDFNGIVAKSVIVDGQGLPLEFKTETEWDDEFTGSTGMGTPLYYGLPGISSAGVQQIAFRGYYPDTAIGCSYKYYRIVGDLGSDETASCYITSYVQGGDNALILGALWLLMESEKEAWGAQDKQAAKDDYLRAVNSMWANNSIPTEDYEDKIDMSWVG